MIDWILNFQFNSLLGIVFYWAPLFLCLFGYTIRTWSNYRHDLRSRAKDGSSYYPTDTVGVVIARIIASTVPVINLFAAAFDVSPSLFTIFFRWLGSVFDTPMVPKKRMIK